MTFNQVVRGSNPRCFIVREWRKSSIYKGFRHFCAFGNIKLYRIVYVRFRLDRHPDVRFLLDGQRPFYRAGGVLFFRQNMIVDLQNDLLRVAQKLRDPFDGYAGDLVAQHGAVVVTEIVGGQRAGFFQCVTQRRPNPSPHPVIGGFCHGLAGGGMK